MSPRIALLGTGRMGSALARRLGALETANGQLFLEMSTAGPDIETELTPRIAATGSYLVDATIVGAPPIVERGEAVILLGGDSLHVERARPILEHLGTVRHVGPPGNGARLKLIANSMLAQIITGAAELQNAGESAGLDPDDVFWLLSRFAPTLETRRPAYVDKELQTLYERMVASAAYFLLIRPGRIVA